VPPTFFSTSQPVADPFADDPFADDPFADASPSKAESGIPSAREIFEKAGISFPAGSSADYDFSSGLLVVRNTEEQLELVEAYLTPLGPDVLQQIMVVVEFIETDHDRLSDWMLNNQLLQGGHGLRQDVQAWVERGDASIVEISVVNGRSGQRCKTESILETRYPTEPGTPDLPNEVELEGTASAVTPAGAVPSAWETRNCGFTLEVDPIVSPDNHTISLNFAPESVRLRGYTHWPPEPAQPAEVDFTVSQPRFQATRITNQLVASDGHYALLGSVRPPQSEDPERVDPVVLVFARADLMEIPILGDFFVHARENEPGDIEVKSYFLSQPLIRTILADGPETPPTRAIRERFESLGITFPKATSLRFRPKTSILTVRHRPDGQECVRHLLDHFAGLTEGTIHVFHERIEVSRESFGSWLFENRFDADATALRRELARWIRRREATLVGSTLVSAMSGSRAKIEGVDEFIYPTAYQPPEIPHSIEIEDGAEAPATATSPTAFETRHLGTTLEVDPVGESVSRIIDLNLAPETISLGEVMHWHRRQEDPRFLTHAPRFHHQKITTQVTTEAGWYTLLGTTSPLEPVDPEREDPVILHFIRADIGSAAMWREVK